MANIDVCVIDDRKDIVMAIDRALSIGELPISGVADMVAKIATKCAGGDKVRELRISGHGNTEGQYIGGDWVDSLFVDHHVASWTKLRTLFDVSHGLVTLEGCKVGQADLLLVKLSNYLAVPVRAFRTFQNPVIPGDEGGETRCFYFSCTKTKKRFTIYDEQATSPW